MTLHDWKTFKFRCNEQLGLSVPALGSISFIGGNNQNGLNNDVHQAKFIKSIDLLRTKFEVKKIS